MPLKINVGLSRKVAEANYGSRGANVNLELELDASLIGEPLKLKDRIHRIFTMVRASLDDELGGQPAAAAAANGVQNKHSEHNGSRQPTQPESAPRPATQSQVKALLAIARSRKLNLAQLVEERFQRARPEDLSLRQASQLIDELKAGG